MREIAETQASAGLARELFLALAEVYADLARRSPDAAPEDVDERVTLEDVLSRLDARERGS
jgi:hypothetical protein